MMDQLSILGIRFISDPHLTVYIQSQCSLPIQEVMCPLCSEAESKSVEVEVV